MMRQEGLSGVPKKRFRGSIGAVNGAQDFILHTQDLGDITLPFAAITKAKLILNDALIKATKPKDSTEKLPITDKV